MTSPTPTRPTLKGVFAASLTPARADGSPDVDAFVTHSKWLLANGCDGVAPLGTTGEANSFSVEQKLGVISAAGANLPKEKVLIGTGACALADAVTLTKAAVAAGCPNALALPPFYYKNPSDDGLFAFFSELIQRVGSGDLQLYVYHFPQQAAVPLSHALIERLIKAYPTVVVGLKDSSGDWEHTGSLCRNFPGFATFAGTETLLLNCIEAGGAGCISATANVTAPMARKVYDAWKNGGDTKGLQEILTRQRLTLQKYPPIAALKALTRRRTGNEIWRNLLPPNMALSPAQEEQLLADLRGIGFFDQVEAMAKAAE